MILMTLLLVETKLLFRIYKKVYEKFIDKAQFDFDTFKIMKSADKKTKWSPEKENLFNELRKILISKKIINFT